MKTGTWIACVGFAGFVAAVFFQAQVVVVLLAAGTLIVGFSVIAVQGLRLRQKEGWKPITTASGVAPQGRFVVMIMVPTFGIVGGIVATLAQIRNMVELPEYDGGVFLVSSIVATIVSVAALFFFRSKRREERRN